MEWFFVAKEKRSKKQGLTASYKKKVINRYFVCFPSFLLMVLRDFFGSINGILFH